MSCLAILKGKGLKLTPQRRLVLDIIHDTEAHLTAEEIITHIQTRMPGINKSTIYRILELLQETGCVFKSALDDQFIYHHAEEGHHHHLACQKCSKIIECDNNLFTPVERSLAEQYGFRVDFTHVAINGLCKNCKSKPS
ncbi:Fur family transcriptional regulator [Chloroflexota bacterium]